jgi:hypothetical protein
MTRNHLRQGSCVKLTALPLARKKPIPQNIDLVAQLQKFIQQMAHEQKRDALRQQSANDRKQPRHFRWSQGGGWLVENHQASVARKRPNQKRELTFGDAAMPHQPPRVDFHP